MSTAPSPEQSRRARRRTEPDPSSLPVLVRALTVVFAALVAGAAHAGYAASVVVLAVLVLALAAGWGRLLDAPTPGGTRAVLVVGGLLLVVALAAADGPRRLRYLPVAVVVGVLGAFVQQLLQRGGRGRLTLGVAASASGLATMASGAALVPLSLRLLGPELVTVAMAALVAAAAAGLVVRVPRLRPFVVLVVLVAGAAAAAAVGAVVGVALPEAVGAGALVAVVSQVMRHVLAALPSQEYVSAQVATAAASVLLPGVVVVAVAVLAGR